MNRVLSHMVQYANILVALCLIFGGVSVCGVTVTYFAPTSCMRGQASSTLFGAPNPLVVPLNDCVFFRNVPQGLWSKPTSCSSSTVRLNLFIDSNCTSPWSTPFQDFTPASCTPIDANSGSDVSLKVTCSASYIREFSLANFATLVALVVLII
jgi:hypothetical protein